MPASVPAPTASRPAPAVRRRWRASRVYPDYLTRREVEVLRLLAAGRTNKAIATALGLSVHTVNAHVASLYAKTGAHNRADATAYAFRTGLAEPAGRSGGRDG